jgi:ribulose-5-phosphate 4-epimerase/fuculose-1-phosphate aldolase
MDRHADVKEALVHYGRKMATNRLTTGTGGNLSAIDRPIRSDRHHPQRPGLF